MEARAYRKILELEEAILLWEEIQKEGGSKDTSILLRKMQEVGFPGTEKMQVFGDDTQLRDLLGFILKVSELTRLKRTGWIRSGIRDPETVAGHMFRMAVMALLLEENLHNDTLKSTIRGKFINMSTRIYKGLASELLTKIKFFVF